MIRPLRSIGAMMALLPAIAFADDFDRLEGQALSAIPNLPHAEPRTRLTLDELTALPNVLQGVRSPVVVVRTDRGNLSRLLLDPGFWSPPPAEGADPGNRPEPVPILILERFATFEGSGGSSPNRLSAGQSVFLFDGFHFDLDSGQVVPEDQGGDIAFVFESGDGPPRLEAVGGASLLPMTQPPEFAEPPPGTPSSGRAILPRDYAGRFLLKADGSLAGTLDLKVDDRAVSGQFRSDQTGTSYEVFGEVEAGADPALRFAIQFPRSEQEYEGVLFSEGKGAMVGTFLLLDRKRPFYAVRENPARSRSSSPEPDREPETQP